MTKEDLELIKSYQEWRRERNVEMNPTELAIDRMITYCELCLKLDEDAENLLP